MCSRARSLRVSLQALLVFAALSSAAPADVPAVAIGEVSARTPAGEFTRELRSALSDELAQAKVTVKGKERFVLSARLVKLTTEKSDGNVRATAVVSVALRRARANSLHAILSGRATAEEAAATAQGTRGVALRAAVRSALRGLARAVEQG